jgi:hypothetical protein
MFKLIQKGTVTNKVLPCIHCTKRAVENNSPKNPKPKTQTKNPKNLTCQYY